MGHAILTKNGHFESHKNFFDSLNEWIDEIDI